MENHKNQFCVIFVAIFSLWLSSVPVGAIPLSRIGRAEKLFLLETTSRFFFLLCYKTPFTSAFLLKLHLPKYDRKSIAEQVADFSKSSNASCWSLFVPLMHRFLIPPLIGSYHNSSIFFQLKCMFATLRNMNGAEDEIVEDTHAYTHLG